MIWFWGAEEDIATAEKERREEEERRRWRWIEECLVDEKAREENGEENSGRALTQIISLYRLISASCGQNLFDRDCELKTVLLTWLLVSIVFTHVSNFEIKRFGKDLVSENCEFVSGSIGLSGLQILARVSGKVKQSD